MTANPWGMATTHTLPSSADEPRQEQETTAETEPMQALTTAPLPTDEEESLPLSGPLARLPVEIDVSVPVRAFRVRNLLALAPGHVVESQWGNGTDMPVSAGEVQLAWSEFEVIDAQLAVRVTRLV